MALIRGLGGEGCGKRGNEYVLEQVLLALAASLFTALASVAQRRAAAPAPGELAFSWRLVTFLLRRPIWFLGILSMIAGFLFQIAALRVGSLALVQPVIATELLFVFAFVALGNRHRVRGRDWLAASGMAAGLGLFLVLARPSGGTNHATGMMWALAGLATFALAAVLTGLAHLPLRRDATTGRRQLPAPARKAALLAVGAAVIWGFVAAVIKELSTHLSQGPVGIFGNWSPYILVLSALAAMFLTSNAFQAGTLAASQPGLTIVDPLVASALGVVLFSESLQHSSPVLAGEAVAVAILVGSVVLLSHSPLVHEASSETPGQEHGRQPGRGADAPGLQAPAGARPGDGSGETPLALPEPRVGLQR